MQKNKLDLNGLVGAIQFLTILPMGNTAPFHPPQMVPFFPIVGLVLGVVLATFDLAAQRLWSSPVVALLDVIVLILMTGALHLDGLGDAADGLCGQRSKDEALAIMKDSRLGTMGLVAILCILAVKWSGILGVAYDRSLLLIIVPAYARSAMIFGIYFLEYGRPGGGTGLEFFKEKPKLSVFWGVILTVVLSFLLGWSAVWLNIGFAIVVAGILFYYKRRLGCITGDMLGALAEVTEALLFLLASAGEFQ